MIRGFHFAAFNFDGDETTAAVTTEQLCLRVSFTAKFTG